MWDPLYPQVGHIAVNPDDGRLIGLDYYGIWASADGTTWELVHKYDGDSIPSHPDRTAIWYREHIIASDSRHRHLVVKRWRRHLDKARLDRLRTRRRCLGLHRAQRTTDRHRRLNLDRHANRSVAATNGRP